MKTTNILLSLLLVSIYGTGCAISQEESRESLSSIYVVDNRSLDQQMEMFDPLPYAKNAFAKHGKSSLRLDNLNVKDLRKKGGKIDEQFALVRYGLLMQSYFAPVGNKSITVPEETDGVVFVIMNGTVDNQSFDLSGYRIYSKNRDGELQKLIEILAQDL